ncbi:MAPEG family protein [Vibrio ulleungensis]|uniref:Microsomal glutathione S-transferase 1 n=1 Tax=Vibrio ulleungensis TaxID=2807619 RepID=A0ABS2HCX0_9VIBR|nr:MAPEG family protein [Vibrio ulleungensis]MBM7035443.1 MAPEG family protein [Vibrio ulleungensis]
MLADVQFSDYHAALLGLLFIVATIYVQSFIAIRAHRKQEHMIPGVVDENLGHDSFVFRSHRTHQNSLENIVPFAVPVFIGLFAGVDAFWLAVVVWVYALARLAHMVLYYKIATDTNPSPRSYFYMVGYLANLVLILLVAAALI